MSKPANLREAIEKAWYDWDGTYEESSTELIDLMESRVSAFLASVGVSEQAVEAATDAVMHDYALFRDPRYGTELTRSEILEIMRVGLEAVAALGPASTPEPDVAKVQAEMDRRLDVLRRFADHWLKIGTDDEQLCAAHDFFSGVLDGPEPSPALLAWAAASTPDQEGKP